MYYITGASLFTTAIYQTINLLFLFIISFGILIGQIGKDEVIAYGVTVAATILAYFGVKTLRFLLVRYHQKWQVHYTRRVQNYLLIGLGGITICACILRIYVSLVNEAELTLLATYSIVISTAALFAWMFLYPVCLMCQLPLKQLNNKIWILIFFNVITAIIAIRIGYDHSEKKRSQEELNKKYYYETANFFTHSFGALLCCVSAIELYIVWSEAFEVFSIAKDILRMENEFRREFWWKGGQRLGSAKSENVKRSTVATLDDFPVDRCCRTRIGPLQTTVPKVVGVSIAFQGVGRKTGYAS